MRSFWFWVQLVGAVSCFATAAVEWRKGTHWPDCMAWLGCGMWLLPTREEGCRG